MKGATTSFHIRYFMISGKGYIKVIEIFRTMWIILKIIDFGQVISFTILWVDNSQIKTPIEELSKEKLYPLQRPFQHLTYVSLIFMIKSQVVNLILDLFFSHNS